MLVPPVDSTPLIRTDFTDGAAWNHLCEAALAESPDGFAAAITPIDDSQFADASHKALISAVAGSQAAILFVADAATLRHPDRPILCIDLLDGNPPFRVVPAALWSVKNNLSLANMDFAEFAEAVDGEGVFRGFD